MIHLYLFGPKSKSKDDKKESISETRKIVEKEFGEEIENLNIREVRDISVNNLQYCATFPLKNIYPISKKAKLC